MWEIRFKFWDKTLLIIKFLEYSKGSLWKSEKEIEYVAWVFTDKFKNDLINGKRYLAYFWWSRYNQIRYKLIFK